MRPLWLSVVLASGRARGALVVASTALVAGLLLVAVSYARLGPLSGFNYAYQHGDAPLLGPIADPGTRGGAILGVVLVSVPLVLLLDQCVRLGAAAQRRRYEALSVAGATRRDLRRWGAVETGGPALVGSALGVVVWLLLRLLLGHALASAGHATLVPTATGPGWWALLVVAVVAAYGGLVGRRAAARATRGVRRERAAPRPWGLAVLGLAVVALIGAPAAGMTSDGSFYLVIVLGVLGLVLTPPWLAYVISGRVSRRTADAAVLLATRRIRADRGAAARAAAAVGTVGLALGVVGVFIADVLVDGSGISDVGYYLVPALLAAVLALLALGVITLSLSLHSIESTLERRREMAALVATGVPVEFLEEATRVECRLVTLPVTVVGALIGGLAYGVLSGPAAMVGGLIAVAVAAGGVLFAVHLVSLATRRWLHQAAALANLRTG